MEAQEIKFFKCFSLEKYNIKMYNLLKEIDSTIKNLKNFPNLNEDVLSILKNIKNELENLNLLLNKNVFVRKIKTILEYNFYKEIIDLNLTGFPKIIKLDENYVVLKKYNKTSKKDFTFDFIIKILNILETINKFGFSHRAININHLLKDDNNDPILVDYGKMTKLGKKSEIYALNPNFKSRNVLLQNPATYLDDLESLGYVLLYMLEGKELNSFYSKNYFIENIKTETNNEFIFGYFSLISKNEKNYKLYKNIFE